MEEERRKETEGEDEACYSGPDLLCICNGPSRGRFSGMEFIKEKELLPPQGSVI